MAYATLVQVENLVPLVAIGATTQPNTTQVTQFLDDRSNEIDAALASRGYETPVASPAWWVADLARLNAEGAAADVLLAAFITGVGADTTSAGALRLKAYQDRLTQIRQGVGIPVATAYQETDQAVRSSWTDAGFPVRPLFRAERRW